MRGRACAMCRGTDVQHTCEQGECYWEYLQQQAAFQQSEDEWRQRCGERQP